MKTATLDQASKILNLLQGLSCEQVQQAIESGLLREVVEKGSLMEARRQDESENRRKIWKLIRRLTKFTSIFITVPHDPYNQRSGDYKLRCWEGKIGNPVRGHVDGGVDLFEVMLSAKLETCDCCWKATICSLGVDVNDSMDGQWVKEIHTARDGSKYDVISFNPHKKGVF